MSEEPSGPALDVTLREFVSGQKLFGRYILIRVLGRGGMGVVWLARDEKLGRDVALKFLPELIIHDPAVLDDLKRETNRSLELTHKNIVRIHDFIYDEKSACISMEYIDGETLSALRVQKEHKIFEPDEIAEWISQVCDALDYAHNQALIVHRDVKPANLMINKRGQLKVADFGVARSLADSVSRLTKEPRGTSGTLVYMSPQQLDGERGSHLDDIYSLGATIYEMLTSKPPFYSGNIDRQIHERIPTLMAERRKDLVIEGRAIPRNWEETVASCLEKNPARRPQAAAEIAHRLSTSLPRIRRVSKLSAKPSARKVMIAGFALCLAVAGAWFYLSHRTASKEGTHEGSIFYTAGSPGVKVNTSPSGATAALNGLEEQKTPATISASPGTYSLFVELDGFKPFVRQVEIRDKQVTDLGTITLKPNNGAIDLTTVPAGAKVFQNGDEVGVTPFQRDSVSPDKIAFILVADGYLPKTLEITVKPGETVKSNTPLEKIDEAYAGTIQVTNAKTDVTPIAVKFADDRKSGTITQSTMEGDLTIHFESSWSFSLLRAKTDVPLSRLAAKSFVMRFRDDGKAATFQVTNGQRIVSANLTSSSVQAQKLQLVSAKIGEFYKGTITGGTALRISFSGDRRSGTITEGSKSGDVIVKFTGIWEGFALHAVTGEVVSKSARVKWEPEAFTLRFADDGKSGSYECAAGGRLYVAELSPTVAPPEGGPLAQPPFAGSKREISDEFAKSEMKLGQPGTPTTEASLSPANSPQSVATPLPIASESPAAAVSPSKGEVQKLSRVYIKRYGLSALIPTDVFRNAHQLSDSDQTFLKGDSWSGKTTLTFASVRQSVAKAYAEYAAEHPRDAPDKTVDYKILKPTWFVVSGDFGFIGNAQMGFYSKGVKKNGDVVIMTLQWNEDDFPFSEETFTAMSRGFDGN